MATIIHAGGSEWKFVRAAKGTEKVTLPSSYTEVKCFVRILFNGLYMIWSFTIYKDVLDEEKDNDFRSGDEYTACVVKVKKSESAIYISDVVVDNASQAGNADLYVYCK